MTGDSVPPAAPPLGSVVSDAGPPADAADGAALPPWQRELRDLCLYRRALVRDRAREKQRARKLLADARIRLADVITDIFGASGRAMLDALAAGQSDPKMLADLARGSMRGKTGVLETALTGQFRDYQGYLLAMMLQRIDALTAGIDALASRIDAVLDPLPSQLAEPGWADRVSRMVAAEITAGLRDEERPPSATLAGPADRPETYGAEPPPAGSGRPGARPGRGTWLRRQLRRS